MLKDAAKNGTGFMIDVFKDQTAKMQEAVFKSLLWNYSLDSILNFFHNSIKSISVFSYCCSIRRGDLFSRALTCIQIDKDVIISFIKKMENLGELTVKNFKRYLSEYLAADNNKLSLSEKEIELIIEKTNIIPPPSSWAADIQSVNITLNR